MVYPPTGSRPRQGDEHLRSLVQYGPFTITLLENNSDIVKFTVVRKWFISTFFRSKQVWKSINLFSPLSNKLQKCTTEKKLKYCILHHMPYNSQTVLDLHQSQDGSVAEWLQLDSGTEGHGFKSQPRRCRVTVLGKLFTPIVPLFTPNSKTGSSPEGNCRPGGK